MRKRRLKEAKELSQCCRIALEFEPRQSLTPELTSLMALLD